MGIGSSGDSICKTNEYRLAVWLWSMILERDRTTRCTSPTPGVVPPQSQIPLRVGVSRSEGDGGGDEGGRRFLVDDERERLRVSNVRFF